MYDKANQVLEHNEYWWSTDKVEGSVAESEFSKRERAREMFRAHRDDGVGEFVKTGHACVLSWPATDKVGEGDGFWNAIITSNNAHCSCPSSPRSWFSIGRMKPCKHLILLSGLIKSSRTNR